MNGVPGRFARGKAPGCQPHSHSL